MKTFITTAAVVAALTFPAFGEGSEDTKGEALANMQMSTISPSQDGPTDRNEIGLRSVALGSSSATAEGSFAMAEGSAKSAKAQGSAKSAKAEGGAKSAKAEGAKAEGEESSGSEAFAFKPGSVGADGGNRK
jgi:hypothetical protein